MDLFSPAFPDFCVFLLSEEQKQCKPGTSLVPRPRLGTRLVWDGMLVYMILGSQLEMVCLIAGETGIIEGTFGTTGKFRVSVAGRSTEARASLGGHIVDRYSTQPHLQAVTNFTMCSIIIIRPCDLHATMYCRLIPRWPAWERGYMYCS